MANVTSKRVDIFIDQTSAVNALNNLQKTADKLKIKIEEGRTAGKNMNQELKKLAETETAIKGVQDQIDKGLRPSISQTQTAVTKLRNELRRMSEDDDGFAEKLQAYKAATSELDRMSEAFKRVEASQKGMKSDSSALTKTGVFFSSLAANGVGSIASDVKNAITDVIKLNADLETSVANLSAITGATGKDLDYLKKSAIDLSIEGSRSAKDFVEAFKLIASAKPELLNAKEDLVAVTKSANLLANASGIELPDAATRLTQALNQFGASASAAGKYVDALAAASKYGAAEVPQITEALLQFGTQAKASNINIYESSAAIELLAEKGIQGAEAGTKLRNVFLAMNAVDALDQKAVDALAAAGVNTDILKDKSLSLQQRLTELGKISGDATALVKVFGKENFNAAQIVLQNIPRYAQLNDQIKEQGVAASQAAINTDTLNNKWEKFKNVVSSFFIQDKGGNLLKSGIDILTGAVKQMINSFDAGYTSMVLLGNAAKNTNAILKDLATFNFKDAGDKIRLLRESETARNKQAKDEKTLSDVRIKANALGEQASTLTIEKQEVLLKQQKAILQGSLETYKSYIAKAKVHTDEGRSAQLTFLQDAQNVEVLTNQLNASKKAVATSDTLDLKDQEKEKKKHAELLKEVESFNQKLHDLKFQSEQASKNDDQKELDAIREKYAEIGKQYEALAKKIKGSNFHLNFSTDDLSAAQNEELQAAIQKQNEKHDKEQVELFKKRSSEEYDIQIATNDKYFEGLKTQEAQRFVDGITGKKEYEANIAAIDVAAKKQNVQTAIDYASSVEKAAAEVTKFQKDELKKQTADLIAAYAEQEASIGLMETLHKKGIEASLQSNVVSTKKHGTLDEQAKAQQELLEHHRNDQLAALDKEQEEALKKITETGVGRLAAESLIKTDIEKRKAAITTQFAIDEEENSKKTFVAKAERDLAYAQVGLDVYTKFAQIRANKENAELQKELKSNDVKKAALKKQLDAKTISQQQYNRGVAALDAAADKKKEEIERKQFERNKRIQIMQTLINAAAGAVKLWVDPGFPAAIPLAIALGVQTIAEVALIASQKFAGGGKVEAPQMNNGKIVTAPNIAAQPNGDNILATVKTGEVILNEKQQADLGGPETFRRIGVPGFAAGGRISRFWDSRPYRSINYTGIKTSLQKNKFAEGGLVGEQIASKIKSVMNETGPVNNNILSEKQEKLIEDHAEVMNKVLYFLQNPVSPEIPLNKIEKAMLTRDQFKKDTEFK